MEQIHAECCFCKATTNDAVEAGYEPDFWDGNIYHNLCVCCDCARKYLIFDDSGERILKPDAPKPPQKPKPRIAANWPAVRTLQERIDNQDPQPLIDFIRVMAQQCRLNRHMLTALCDTSLVERRDEWERWELLHALADGKITVSP